MPVIVIEVMPKAELLDPQGKAVAGALNRLGTLPVQDVRLGKRFEITVDGEVTDAVLGTVRRVAEEVLANGVIEDVVAITVAGAESSSNAGCCSTDDDAGCCSSPSAKADLPSPAANA